MKSKICKDDLLSLGYKPHTAMMIVRQAKKIMVQKGIRFTKINDWAMFQERL